MKVVPQRAQSVFQSGKCPDRKVKRKTYAPGQHGKGDRQGGLKASRGYGLEDAREAEKPSASTFTREKKSFANYL